MAGRAVEPNSNVKHRTANRELACSSRGELPAATGPRRLSILRIIRFAQYPEYRCGVKGGGRRKSAGDATNKTVSGREDVVRTFLASAVARILETRAGRKILP